MVSRQKFYCNRTLMRKLLRDGVEHIWAFLHALLCQCCLTVGDLLLMHLHATALEKIGKSWLKKKRKQEM